MTIWLLAFVLLASLAGLGYRQGVIRVAFSLLGIVLGALLAWPLSGLVKPLLTGLGFKNPVLIWVLAPLVVFVLVSAIFKAAALPVHQKVDVYFKYRAGDLRLALWERLHRRLGLCLGLCNGTAYLALISFLAYALSYWTFQMGASDQDPTSIKVVNRMGRDLQSTGLAKVARAIDPLPQLWYDSADLAGLIYNNPMSEARLSRYPGFLSLAERRDFKDLGSDKEFAELRQRRAPLMEFLRYPRIEAMLQNPDLVQLVWNTVVPDMQDLVTFLETGQSPKYDSEKILGRWSFDVNAAINSVRRLKPNMQPKELLAVRRHISMSFERTSLVAMADHAAIFKNLPSTISRLPPGGLAGVPVPAQTLSGRWDDQAGKYGLNFPNGVPQDYLANIEGDRLTIATAEGWNLVFNRED
jgi:hypothetical protein